MVCHQMILPRNQMFQVFLLFFFAFQDTFTPVARPSEAWTFATSHHHIREIPSIFLCWIGRFLERRTRCENALGWNAAVSFFFSMKTSFAGWVERKGSFFTWRNRCIAWLRRLGCSWILGQMWNKAGEKSWEKSWWVHVFIQRWIQFWFSCDLFCPLQNEYIKLTSSYNLMFWTCERRRAALPSRIVSIVSVLTSDVVRWCFFSFQPGPYGSTWWISGWFLRIRTP